MEVVLALHGGTSHHPFLETLKELKRHWASDLREQGIISAYVCGFANSWNLASKWHPNGKFWCAIKCFGFKIKFWSLQ